MAVYLISDNHSAANAVELLGEQFDGTLVSDDYAVYDAVEAKHRQTCWNHLRTKSKEVLQQIEQVERNAQTRKAEAGKEAGKVDKAEANAANAKDAKDAKDAKKAALPVPPVAVIAPRSAAFCRGLDRFALRMCALGRRMRGGKLSLRKAKAMVPSLRRQLKRFAGEANGPPLENAAAETLRQRVLVKDKDKLFTFLKVKGVQPTNNHAERALRFLVIMRKICFGTRCDAGSESHAVLPSLLQTAKLQGKDALAFLVTLLTKPLDAAKAALFGGKGDNGGSAPRPGAQTNAPTTTTA